MLAFCRSAKGRGIVNREIVMVQPICRAFGELRFIPAPGEENHSALDGANFRESGDIGHYERRYLRGCGPKYIG